MKYTVTKNCSLHRICTNIMDHKHHLATECNSGSSSMHAINVVICPKTERDFDMSFTQWLCSKCHTIILLLLFLQHAVCMLRIVCKFSVCMKYPDDLLYLPESAKYNSSTLKSVQKLCSEWHTIIQLLLYCVNTVNSMWIFCMHGMPGLPATFAEI